MMKPFYYYLCVSVFFMFCLPNTYSQRISVGVLSGTNISYPKGEFTYGKWKANLGSTSGVFVQYFLSKTISFQTEVNYTSNYYSHIGYGPYSTNDIMLMSYSVMPPWYYYSNEKLELNSFRIPVMVKYSTPTKLRFELSAGLFWSFLHSHTYAGPPSSPIFYNDIYHPYSSFYYHPIYSYPSYSNIDVPKRDFGYHFSAGISYPISNAINASLSGRLYSGTKELFERYQGKARTSEVTLGLGYKISSKPFRYEKDSTTIRYYLVVKGGSNWSQITGDNHNNSYSGRTGSEAGISFIFPASRHFAFATELMFQRKGYKMDDNTASFFRYTGIGNSDIESTIDLNYITVPLLVRYSIGNNFKVFVTGGAYLSFMMSSRVAGTAITESKSSYGYSFTNTTINDRVDGNFISKDLGYTLGGGIDIPLYKGISLEIESRYNIGTKNILQKSTYITSASDNVFKNRSVQYTAGLVFPIYKMK